MTKLGRNAPCPCGSGLKYKRCCEEKDMIAAADRAFNTFEAGEQAEIHLFDQVYQSVLRGVWTAFHAPSSSFPEVRELEDFYRQIYGYDLDDTLVDEMIFPLSPRAQAQIIAANEFKEEQILDVKPEEGSPPEEP